MIYFLFGGGFLIGGLFVFLIFKLNILNITVILKKKPIYNIEEEFYKKIWEKTDLSILKNAVDIIEYERQRISQDIHDELGQSLSSLYLELSIATRESADISFQLNHLHVNMKVKLELIIESVRSIIYGMRPAALRDKDIIEATIELCEKYDGTKGIHIIFESVGESYVLPEQHEIQLYRIIQELLNNCSKHSFAWEAYVRFDWHETKLKVTVSDNGIGLSEYITSTSTQYGLIGIFARSNVIGAKARFNIPEKGMEFVLTLPLQNQSSI